MKLNIDTQTDRNRLTAAESPAFPVHGSPGERSAASHGPNASTAVDAPCK